MKHVPSDVGVSCKFYSSRWGNPPSLPLHNYGHTKSTTVMLTIQVARLQYTEGVQNSDQLRIQTRYTISWIAGFAQVLTKSRGESCFRARKSSATAGISPCLERWCQNSRSPGFNLRGRQDSLASARASKAVSVCCDPRP